MTEKKAIVALASGFEEIEALMPVDLLRRAGVKVNMASVEGMELVTGARGITIKTDVVFADIDFKDYDMLILPGGMPGTKNLEASQNVMEAIEYFLTKGKYVAAICAAPSILLGKHGFLEGKEATCYPGMENNLPVFVEKSVVVSENIITSRGVGTALEFALTLIEVLLGKDKSREIAHSVVSKY